MILRSIMWMMFPLLYRYWPDSWNWGHNYNPHHHWFPSTGFMIWLGIAYIQSDIYDAYKYLKNEMPKVTMMSNELLRKMGGR